jgi:hypothetical protein
MASSTIALTGIPHDELQRMVDRAASFNVLVAPEDSQPPTPLTGGGQLTGIHIAQSMRRLDIAMMAGPAGVKASNRVGPDAGWIDADLWFIRRETEITPDRRPLAIPLDAGVSQRCALQNVEVSFGPGNAGFSAFGAGRTFAVFSGGRAALTLAAIGNITSGFGRFAGHDGNFTLCGTLSPESGFSGHIMFRVVDPRGDLLVARAIQMPDPSPSPDREATYLTHIGRKPLGAPDLVNTPSFALDGSLRGLNIPVQSRQVTVGFDPNGFTASALDVGEIIGREIGFGKGSVPGASAQGTPLDPFLFEGVSCYSFYDAGGRTVGTFTANVIEGRRFDVILPGAPEEPALRFGFFGPIVAGTGCFERVQGMLCGASGSVFHLPPGDHVISNWYVARLLDPDGRFRAER